MKVKKSDLSVDMTDIQTQIRIEWLPYLKSKWQRKVGKLIVGVNNDNNNYFKILFKKIVRNLFPRPKYWV